MTKKPDFVRVVKKSICGEKIYTFLSRMTKKPRVYHLFTNSVTHATHTTLAHQPTQPTQPTHATHATHAQQTLKPNPKTQTQT